MSLYVGTNYHPHDWTDERWKTDIDLMKKAGFNMVRLGHLCWDSYEPEEGRFTFAWFDQVMDLFEEAGIKVFLDVSMRPAPVWVHKLCPGCDIHSKSGNRQSSLRRYMEDVADPAYQYYALRFASILTERYKDHPALFAFGLCNEIGDGYLSHSEYARNRFINWLRKKYGTVDKLNEAWAARRWSRKLTSFEDAVLQENEITVGAPEAWLDMRRFFSDGIGQFQVSLKKIIEKTAPGVPHSANHYAEKEKFGFDYLKYSDEFVDFPGMGFYPGYDTGEKYHFLGSIYQQRLAETGKPMWCLEFQTGSKGIICGPYGALRMHAFLCLLNRAQMLLGWTWRSMLGGEEQYLYGILGHDGNPTPNYYEYQKIAEDVKKLEKYAFPYLPKPEIAVAYSHESAWVSQYSDAQFRLSYADNMTAVHRTFIKKNLDYNIVDLCNLKNDYKLIIIPGHLLMKKDEAETIRKYVEQGGNVIMTGYSGTVDETGKVFSEAKPGYLADVFGIRVDGFYRTDMECFFSEKTEKTEQNGKKHEIIGIIRGKEKVNIDVDYYESIVLNTADEYAAFDQKDCCAVSINHYGKGTAFYVATETNEYLLGWILDMLTRRLRLQSGLKVPDGIQARRIDINQYFYVNTSSKEVCVPLEKPGKGILSGKEFESELYLKGYDAELIVAEE